MWGQVIKWLIASLLITVILWIVIAPGVDLPDTTLRAAIFAVLLFASLRNEAMLALPKGLVCLGHLQRCFSPVATSPPNAGPLPLLC